MASDNKYLWASFFAVTSSSSAARSKYTCSLRLYSSIAWNKFNGRCSFMRTDLATTYKKAALTF